MPRPLRSRPDLSLLALAGLLAAGCGGASSGKPNILLYVSDTLRADSLSCYGNETVETPRFDRFAEEGVLFETAIAPSSWTRASMGAILTGTAPRVHGAEKRYDLLEDSVQLLPELLEGEGYTTANITTNRNVGSFFGFDQGWSDGGFIELYELEENKMVRVAELTTLAGDVTRRAIEWLETAPEPWCLVVHTIDPHSPYRPPADWDRYGRSIRSEVDGSQRSLTELAKGRRTKADERKTLSLYYGEIAYNDHAFGELVDYLDQRGLYDDLVAVVTSDHGEEFWELGARGHGKNVHEKALQVPLLVRGPGVPRGVRESRLVSTTDLLPTIFDLAGLHTPYWVDGRSVFDPPQDEPVVFASSLLQGRELYVVRTPAWKLVWDAETDERFLFDMRDTDIEGQNVIRENREVAQGLFERLTTELKRQVDKRVDLHGSPLARVVGEIPEEIAAELEALGYAEGDEDEDETVDPDDSESPNDE